MCQVCWRLGREVTIRCTQSCNQFPFLCSALPPPHCQVLATVKCQSLVPVTSSEFTVIPVLCSRLPSLPCSPAPDHPDQLPSSAPWIPLWAQPAGPLSTSTDSACQDHPSPASDSPPCFNKLSWSELYLLPPVCVPFCSVGLQQFTNLNTKWRQNTYFNQKWGVVEPSHWEWDMTTGKIRNTVRMIEYLQRILLYICRFYNHWSSSAEIQTFVFYWRKCVNQRLITDHWR